MNKKKKAIKRMFFSAIALILSLVAGIGVAFAWFVQNESVKTDGLNFHTDDTQVNFSDTIYVSRKINGTPEELTYIKVGSTYRLNGDETGERLNFLGLLPGERVEFVFRLESKSILSGYKFSLGLTGLYGKTFSNDDENDTTLYSILGIYKMSGSINGTDIVDSQGSPYIWLADFDGGGVKSPAYLVKDYNYNAMYDDQIYYVDVVLKLTVDTTEFYKISGIANKQPILSEAEVNIRSIFVRLDR